MRKKEKKSSMGESEDLGNVYEEEEFVIYKMPDGNVRSCGFDVNSALLREGKKPMYTIHNQDIFVVDDSKNEVSDLFKHMAVPAGLFYMNTASASDSEKGIGEERGLYRNVEDEEEINDDIYDKLMDLVTEMEKRRKNKETRKTRLEKKVKKTTRKKR